MREILLIGFAGLIGTLTRYFLSVSIDAQLGRNFPVGTLAVNLIGCFLVGYVFHVTEERYVVDPVIRTAILVGFFGGFTTFSTYALQTFNFLRAGDFLPAIANMIVSNVAGLILVWLGYAAVR